jgi:diamine N-acetyltransferase
VKQYLENAQQDIYEAKQLRLATDPAVGLIDLFVFQKTIGQGGYRNTGTIIEKNIGSEALGLLIQYSFNNLNLHQLYANIGTENEASKALFY